MCRLKNFVHKFSLPIRIFHLGFIQFIILFMFLILIPGHTIQCYETYDEFDQLAEESSPTSLALPIIDISTTTFVPDSLVDNDDKIYKKKFNHLSRSKVSSSSLNALTSSFSITFDTKNSKDGNRPFSLFSCHNKSEGYYADSKFCDIFHYCKINNKRYTFVCPANSYYNSESLICEHYNLTLTLKNRNCIIAKISDVERYKYNGEIENKSKVNKELHLTLANQNNDARYDGIVSASSTETSKKGLETTLKLSNLKQLSPQQQTSQSSTLIANFLDPPTVVTTAMNSSAEIKSLISMANHVDPYQQQKQKQSKQLHLMNNQTIVASTADALRQQKQKEKLKKIRALEKQFLNRKLNPASTTTLIPPSLFSEPIDIVPDLANDGTQPHPKYPKHEFIINHLQTTTTTASTPTTVPVQLLTTPSSPINQNLSNKLDIINKIKNDNNKIELMNKEKFILNKDNNNNNNNDDNDDDGEQKKDLTTTTTCRPMAKQSFTVSPTTVKRLVQPPFKAATNVFNRNDAYHHHQPHLQQHSKGLLSSMFMENNIGQKIKTKEFKSKINNLTFVDYRKEQLKQNPQRIISKQSYPSFWQNNNGNGIKLDLSNNQLSLNSKNHFKMNDNLISSLLQPASANNNTIYKGKHLTALSIENGDELFDNDNSYSMLPLSASSPNDNGNNGKFTLSIHKFIRESLPTQYLKSVPRFFKNFIYNNNNNNFYPDPSNKLKQEQQQGPNNDNKLNHNTLMAFVKKDNEESDIDMDNMDTLVNGADDGGAEKALAAALALTTFTMFDKSKLQGDSKKFDPNNKINYRHYNYHYPLPQGVDDYYIDQLSTINSDNNKNNGEKTQKSRQQNSIDLLLNNISHNDNGKDNVNDNKNKHVNSDGYNREISLLTASIDDDDDNDDDNTNNNDDDDKISMLNIPVLVPAHLKQDDYRQHMSESLLRPIVIPLKEKDKLLVPAYVLELNSNEHVRLKRSSSASSLASLSENILNHNNKDHLTAKKLLKFPIKTNLLSNLLPAALKNKLLKSTKLANSISNNNNNHNENAVKSALEQVQSGTGPMQNINTIPLYFPTSEYESYLNLFKTDNNNNNNNNNNNIYDLKEFSNHFLSPYYFSNVDTTPAYYSSSTSTSSAPPSPTGHNSKSSMLFSSSTNLSKHSQQHKVNHYGKTSNKTAYDGSFMSQHYPSAFMPSLAFPFSYPSMNQINYAPTKQNELIKNGKYGYLSNHKNVVSSTSAETGTTTNVQKIPAPSSANIYVPDELFEDFQVFKPTKAVSESVAKVAVGSTKLPTFTSKLTELNEPNESNLLITYTGIKDALNRYNGRINKKIDTLSSIEETSEPSATISTTTLSSASTTTINIPNNEHSNKYQIIDHNKNMFIINYSNGSALRIAGKKMKDLNPNDLTGKKDLNKILSTTSTVRATMLVAPGIHTASFANKNDDIKRTTDSTPSNTFTAQSFTLEPSSDYFSPKTLFMGTIHNNGRKSSSKASKNSLTN